MKLKKIKCPLTLGCGTRMNATIMVLKFCDAVTAAAAFYAAWPISCVPPSSHARESIQHAQTSLSSVIRAIV
jgi:hypothetical protein